MPCFHQIQSQYVSNHRNKPACVDNDFGRLFEIIPGKLSFTIHRDENQTLQCINEHKALFFFSSWEHESYIPFNSDFGPVNIASVVDFCKTVRSKMEHPKLASRHLVFYCNANQAYTTNAVFLLGAYLVLEANWSPESAAEQLGSLHPSLFKPFRDSTSAPSTFDLNLLDCLRGLYQATKTGIFSVRDFDIRKYDALDEYGFMQMVCPKFIAFPGPRDDHHGPYFFSPHHYLGVFRALGVSSVVRLNEAEYSKETFQNAGINHHTLYFDDCTTPSAELVEKFLKICEDESGVIAVHCMAGLGRTGTMIGCWMMREYGWSARETIAWLRIVRPGMVIGPQQHFLLAMELQLNVPSFAMEADILAASSFVSVGAEHSKELAAQVSAAKNRRVEALTRCTH